MLNEGVAGQLKTQEKFFMNTISCFAEEDSAFKPDEKTYTVAQHVGHAAETVTWFFDGAFGDKGFDMDFENYAEHMKKYISFNEAVEQLKDAYAKGIKIIEGLSEVALRESITGEVMKGAPKTAIVAAIGDHTAHHRGALAVYARLLGKVPQMPYEAV